MSFQNSTASLSNSIYSNWGVPNQWKLFFSSFFHTIPHFTKQIGNLVHLLYWIGWKFHLDFHILWKDLNKFLAEPVIIVSSWYIFSSHHVVSNLNSIDNLLILGFYNHSDPFCINQPEGVCKAFIKSPHSTTYQFSKGSHCPCNEVRTLTLAYQALCTLSG